MYFEFVEIKIISCFLNFRKDLCDGLCEEDMDSGALGIAKLGKVCSEENVALIEMNSNGFYNDGV